MSKQTEIFIIDDLSPEDIAMLQALYSRSGDSVQTHLEKLKKKNSSKFMEEFYVGYGHASIADCGTSYAFIENVSMLTAKAFEDNTLFNGQESSSRYISFAEKGYYDPFNTEESKKIMDEWFKFYNESFPIVYESLLKQYPWDNTSEITETIHNKALKARTFDILRGFLPAGTKTQFSWTSSLRKFNDKINDLLHHPLEEVRNTSAALLADLKEKYPGSFSKELDFETTEWMRSIAEDNNYQELTLDDVTPLTFEEPVGFLSLETTFDKNHFENSCKILEQLKNRPKWSKLPNYLKKYGNFGIRFLLDYGSFRDIQRHRNGVCRIPLLTTEFGFNEWYLQQLPEEIKNSATDLLYSQVARIEYIKNNSTNKSIKYDLQYLIPMGFNVACEVEYDIGQMVYVLELRTPSTVHPTLRKVMKEIYNIFEKFCPDVKVYVDLSEDKLCLQRGKQDIIVKSNA